MSISLNPQLKEVNQRIYRERWVAGIASGLTLLAIGVITACFIVNYTGGTHEGVLLGLVISIPIAFFSLGFAIKFLGHLYDDLEKRREIKKEIKLRDGVS